MSRTQSFPEVLLDCIDEGLSVLGNEPKLAVYQYLSSIHSLDREQIPEKVDQFSAGMRRALGSASKVIERLILKKLYQRIGSTFREVSDLDFTDYVTEAKRRFELTSRHSDPADNARSKKGEIPG